MTPIHEPPPQNNRRAALESLAAALGFATMSTMVHGFGDSVAWPFVAFVRMLFTFVFVFATLCTGADDQIDAGDVILIIGPCDIQKQLLDLFEIK